ncbi:MAG: carbonic anhydrase family protein [Erythrobacter sp.]
MKFSSKFFVAAMASVSLAACSQADTATGDAEAGADEKKVAWDYGDEKGPANWGTLSEEYAACASGLEQSPIDLPAASEANLITVTTNYGETSAEVVDLGKTIQANVAEGMSLISGDTEYGLVQVHMHTPSENTVEGKAFPMTAHFVHASAEGAFAVLGIMFEEGEANPAIDAILGNVGSAAELDLSDMLPAELNAYNFPGSLTTPPCTEGVNWHVVSTPVSASAEQIAALTEAMGNNARPVQPLNEREL